MEDNHQVGGLETAVVRLIVRGAHKPAIDTVVWAIREGLNAEGYDVRKVVLKKTSVGIFERLFYLLGKKTVELVSGTVLRRGNVL